MRPHNCWVALCLVFGSASGALAQEQTFPYTAHVLAEDVYVRSGPGKSYYPTDKMTSGDEIEVYRHDPGGWLAIRPPEGSFSWVSARFLRPLGNGLAVVTGEEVVSRVGSRFSNVRDAIQVRLEKGEQVELIEEQTVQGQSWYKIAPPAGEFRWISASYVNRELSASGLSEPRSLTNLAPEGEVADAATYQQAGISTTQLVAAQEAIERRLAEADPGAQLAGYDEPAFDSNVQTAQYQEVLPRRQSAASLRPRENTARLAPPVAPERSWSASTESTGTSRVPLQLPKGGLNFSAELATIDIDLGSIIANEPTTWNFHEISARLEILSRVATTGLQRGQVREMESKVARLDEIRLRNIALAAGRPLTGGVGTSQGMLAANSLPLPPQTGISAPGAATAAPAGSGTTLPFIGAAAGSSTAPSEFDGEGVLRPVVSKRRNAPRFALVDAAGNVSSFVTPAPGLNLQPYVGQKVGMIGTRGFMQELRKPHVMAKRVSLLDQNAKR
jgi:uncharacterized protein YgiM (DUF1202 family)